MSLIPDSQGSEAERFRVGKPLGNHLSQPSQCMEEEIETQKDETNWSADFPANAFPTQTIRLTEGKIMWQFVPFKREFLEVI